VRFTQVRRLVSAASFAEHLAAVGADLRFDDDVVPAPAGPLAQPVAFGRRTLGNRFAILPMEGWDGAPDGSPTALVERRWRRFGASGAKLIWGGEAVAVRHDGRANPRQLVLDERTAGHLADLRSAAFGDAPDVVVGLQLTHSGRFSRPEGSPAPRTAYRHPVLDDRVGADDRSVLSDGELDDLAATYVDAAVLAAEAGFDFVDVKCCHGYLLHELLSAVDRPGRYGGDLDGRSRFVLSVIAGIRAAAPRLEIGVRLSVFDVAPHGVATGDYRYAFGGDGSGRGIDLDEPHRFVELLVDAGVVAVCVTAGSPYYCPHVQRPAYHPPSDGYAPPRDPLVEVARLLAVTADVKARHPGVVVVGSGYSYLQEWLPNVAQRAVADGAVDVVGLGRMALSYPGLPADVLAGRLLDRRLLCRTFSDCTTGPRNGLVSGCYPLDSFYRDMPERLTLAAAKRRAT
jgi:NADPH2 dehydrogenase